jgi:peroxiredoxin
MTAEATLHALDGSTRPLASLWSSGPVLLLFLRHFACPSCSSRIDRWVPRARELEALGIGLAVIGCGSTSALTRFAERLGLDAPRLRDHIFASSDRAAYAAFGLGASTWGTFGPRAALAAASLYAAGHYATRHDDDGDLTQQGGAVLVDDSGAVLFRHAEASLADASDPSDAIDAALRWAAGRLPV